MYKNKSAHFISFYHNKEQKKYQEALLRSQYEETTNITRQKDQVINSKGS